MLELYHGGLTQASVKVRLTFKEKGLAFKSHFLRLTAGEHLEPAYLALNPDGQVPTLVHDGAVITETTVINEYLDDVFPDPPLRPADPVARARMRRWGQITDEYLFHSIATLGWHAQISRILQARDPAWLDDKLARIPLHEKREKWLKAARTGFTPEDLEGARRQLRYAIGLMEKTLASNPYLAGSSYSLADINVLSSLERFPRYAPDLMNAEATPHTHRWLQEMLARPAVQATYSVSDEAPPRSSELYAMQKGAAAVPVRGGV